MTRKNSTRDYWKQHYQLYKSQGITQREYCINNNLGYHAFNKWKRQFDQENQSTAIQQLPVKYLPPKNEQFEILFQDNLKIIIPENFSPETLKQIMFALREEV